MQHPIPNYRSSPYNEEDRSGIIVEVDVCTPVTPDDSSASEADFPDDAEALYHTSKSILMKVHIYKFGRNISISQLL